MAIYGIFKLLDMAIYSLVKDVVRLIILLANYQFFSTDTIRELTDRIYIVLGVLVLFKIVISCVEYMVNPDTFDDKDKGMVGILKKSFISIALLALTPAIFDFALSIQASVVSTIPSLVMGTGSQNYTVGETSKSNLDKQLDEIGDLVAGSTITAFVVDRDTDQPMKGTTLADFDRNILDGCNSGGLIAKYFTTDQCDYKYMWGVSTAAGVFLLYVLLSMTLDVGIRAIKIGIIRIFAPIPISSYIVSNDKLKKFFKLASSVYLDIFIRLIVIYFIIFFVKKVIEEIKPNVPIASGYTASGMDALYIKIIIICALFMFAKSAPKFICDVLGLDSGGFGDMKDMFKPAWQRAGGAVGALTNPLSNAVANYNQSRANGGKVGRNLRRALGGAGRGLFDALAGAAAGDDWKKMRARHEAAKNKSNERSLKQMHREKNEETLKNRIAGALGMKEKLQALKDGLITKADREQAKANLAQRKEQLNDLAEKIKNTSDPAEREKLIRQWKAGHDAIADEAKFLKEEAVRVAAGRQVQAKIDDINVKIDGANATIASINAQIAAGNKSAQEIAELEAQKIEQQENIAKYEEEREKITHEKAKKEAEATLAAADKTMKDLDTQMDKEREAQKATQDSIAEIENSVAQDEAALKRTNMEFLALQNGDVQDNERYIELSAERQQIESRIKVSRDTIEQKKQDALKYDEVIEKLSKQKEEVSTNRANAQEEVQKVINIIDAEQEQRIQTIADEYKKYEDAIKQQQTIADQAGETLYKADVAIGKQKYNGVKDFFGISTTTGKNYLDLSSFLGSSRSNIYTGEAMTKMRQNANILVNEDGSPVTYKSDYCNIKGREFSYEEIRSLWNDVQSHNIDIKTLREKYGFDSSAVLQSAFEDIEKNAARDYINANLAAINEGIRNNRDIKQVRLKNGAAPNSAVIEWYEDFVTDLSKTGLSAKEIEELTIQFMNDPGSFIKNASAMKDKYAGIGKRIVDSTKPDDGKK